MGYKLDSAYVYLDYAATAPLCEEARSAMDPYLVPGRANVCVGGNANSLHSAGRAAFEQLEAARRSIAHDIGASRPSELIFTSGATEADNAAILGIAHACAAKRNYAVGTETCPHDSSALRSKPHVVVSSIEHEAILAPAKMLEAREFSVTYLAPDARGFITPDALAAVLCPDTLLVSIQAANSELGSVQPIAALACLAHENGSFFHTDATQALGKIPLDVGACGVDAASFAAHKVGGPKGIGALYLRARTPFAATQVGGGQEGGFRSGTQNVCGAVGFAAATRAVCAMQLEEARRLRGLRDMLYAALNDREEIRPTLEVSANSEDFLPNIVHALARGIESETLILRLDELGFGVSGGSACASHSLEPSRVLRAIGIGADEAHGALRVSMGRYTTEDDIRGFLDALKRAFIWDNE